MSDIIRMKRSGVTGAAPTSLELGEIALNYADGKIYYKNLSGSIVEFGGSDPRWSALAPAAPTGVTASAGNAQATVSWTAPSSIVAITDYVVQFSSNNGSTWTTFSDGTSTSTSATVTGLTNGTSYTFRVAAVSGIGQGAWSAASSAVTPVAATVPGAPTLVSATTLSCNQLDLSWTAPASNGGSAITAYRIRRAADGYASVFATVTAPTTTFRQTNTGGSYDAYRISAVNSVGEGAYVQTGYVDTSCG